jgi:uncharacterized RDD family membrane protein YckC
MIWYFADGSERRGPVTEAEFATLAAQGKIRPETLVWHEGLPRWTPYRDVVSDAIAAAPFHLSVQPEAGPRYAGFWIRYVAKYLDNLFVGVCGTLLALVFWLLSRRPFDDINQLPLALFAAFIGQMAVSCVYHVAFVGATGATPGKMFLKLEIVRADGAPIGYGLALRRWLAAALNYATLMIGWMAAGWSEEKRGLHDVICGTRVLDHGSRVGGPAGFWIRYVAKSLDNLVLVSTGAVIGITLGIVFAITLGQDGIVMARVIGFVVSYPMSFAYFTYFVGSRGATPGKMILGLKVIREDGSPLTYGRASGRWFAAALNYLSLYVGWMIAAFTSQKRGMHDMICDTRVIHVR